MTTDTTLAENRTDEILVGMVSRRAPIVVSHRTPLGWRVCHARFTGADLEARTIQAALATRGSQPAQPQLKPGNEVGVTFRRAHKKCSFSTVVLESRPDEAEQLVLRWPEHLQELHRRVFERTAPPPGKIIPVTFWKLADAIGGIPSADDRLTGVLEDLSVGGIRILWQSPTAVASPLVGDERPPPTRGDATAMGHPSELPLEATYCCRISLDPHEEDLVVEAMLRHHEAPTDGAASLGFRFIGLETTEEGRRNMIRLARAVSRFQRRRSNAARIRLHRRRRSR